MERYQSFIGRVVERSRLDEKNVLESAGLDPRYLPDAFEEFTEAWIEAVNEHLSAIEDAIVEDREWGDRMGHHDDTPDIRASAPIEYMTERGDS